MELVRPKSEKSIERERRCARRKYDRKFGAVQQDHQNAERSLHANLKICLKTGQTAKARQIAKDLQHKKLQLVQLEKQQRHVSMMNSKATSMSLSADICNIATLDTEAAQMRAKDKNPVQFQETLERYATEMTKTQMTDDLMEDILEGAFISEDDTGDVEDAEEIIRQTEAEIAMDLAGSIAPMKPHIMLSGTEEENGQGDEEDALLKRFRKLQDN
jgi:hypothetical protein